MATKQQKYTIATTTQVLCAPHFGLKEQDVFSRYSEGLERKKHPTYEPQIEEVWEKKLKEGCHLFDKEKFRFHRAILNKSNNELALWLGPTSYKEYIGTNCAPYAKDLLDLGMFGTTDENDGSGHSYLAQPLGVGTLIQTSDSKFVFIKRSHLCAEAPGFIDVPGGHPEPEQVTPLGLKEVGFVETSEITKEIFSSALKEIEDEVNIPQNSLGTLQLLGISFNEDTCYRPSLEFYVCCSLSSEEVLQKYKEQTQSENYESTDIIFISLQELQNLCQTESGKMWEQLTNGARSALYLFSIFSSWRRHLSTITF